MSQSGYGEPLGEGSLDFLSPANKVNSLSSKTRSDKTLKSKSDQTITSKSEKTQKSCLVKIVVPGTEVAKSEETCVKQEKLFRSSTHTMVVPKSCLFTTFEPSSITNAVLLGERYYLALDSAWSCAERLGVASLTDGSTTLSITPSMVHYDSASTMYYVALDSTTKADSFIGFVTPEVGEDVTLLPIRNIGGSLHKVVLPGRVRGVSNADSLSGRPGVGKCFSYTCETLPGDCGAVVISNRGFVGFHVGCDLVSKVNVFWSPPSKARESLTSFVVGRPVSNARFKCEMKNKEALVSMQPAPSDYLGTQTSHVSTLDQVVDSIVNPWSPYMIRVPDTIITPTSVGKLYANRTYNVTATSSLGPNIMFGMHTRLSLHGTATPPVAASGVLNASAAPQNVYQYSPGNILTPIQWGLGSYADPYTAFAPLGNTGGFVAGGTEVWGDDFGSSLSSMLGYVTAYRTTSAGVRIRILGLPSGNFMTPGKIYFAQVRYNNTDLPLTEQDFVILETLGRAVHVSADAVREAGSKTIFFTPDAPQKFDMTSNFFPAPGLYDDASTDTRGVRLFPQYASANLGTFNDRSYAIVPFAAEASVYGGNANRGVDGSLDSNNADGTALLLIAYFGAADDVVLEVNYALNFEYIPNKSAPTGIETRVQLPNSEMLDQMYSAAAVLTEAKPYLIQSKGDKTITSGTRLGPAPTSEALKVKEKLVKIAGGARGQAYREGFWDFSWLKSGNIGPLSWDFRDPVMKRIQDTPPKPASTQIDNALRPLLAKLALGSKSKTEKNPKQKKKNLKIGM